MILLACAVAKELVAWSGRHDVETLVTGVGPVEAACAVAHALARQRYTLVVNAGLAGAFEGAARIGDGVVIAGDSLELGLESGLPLVLPDGEVVTDSVHSDAALVAGLVAQGFAALQAVTVARVTATEATAARLANLGAQAESMEGFAVLRAARRARVPAIELRGISNRVGDRARSGWNFDAGIAGLDRVMRALFLLLDATQHESPT